MRQRQLAPCQNRPDGGDGIERVRRRHPCQDRRGCRTARRSQSDYITSRKCPRSLFLPFRLSFHHQKILPRRILYHQCESGAKARVVLFGTAPTRCDTSSGTRIVRGLFSYFLSSVVYGLVSAKKLAFFSFLGMAHGWAAFGLIKANFVPAHSTEYMAQESR